MSNHSGKNRLIVLLYWQFSRTQYALNEVLEERLKQKRGA